MTDFKKMAAWLLLSTVSLIVFMAGCKKDRFEPSESQQLSQPILPGSKITIEEAQNYFSSIDLSKLQASVPDSLKSPMRIKIEPDWGKAVLGNSQSGREIVLVPLADTTLFSINEGRARAQLVFSRSGPDTIFAQILLYAATPEYHAAHPNNYSLNNFSGAFVFFDLFCNFQFGVAMNAGTPFAFVDSIGYTKTNVLDDRTVNCTDYVDIFEVCEAWEWASVNCHWEIHIYTFCTESGDGGSGGGGGGSGGGGSGPIPIDVYQQYAYLAPLIQSGQLTYQEVLLLGIPLNIFYYFGGQIPYNLNASQYNALVQLNTLCQFDGDQFQWVTEHPSLISPMLNLLGQHNNDPAWIDALKDVIDARIGGTNLFSFANMAKLVEMQVSLGLTEGQLRWVVENSRSDMPVKVLDKVYPFFERHNNEEDADQFLKDHLDEMMSNPSYKEFITSSFGWPAILWTIGKELIYEKGVDIILNLIPGFNKQDDVRDGIKALANGDWLEFTWEAAKIVVGQVPWVKALGVATQLRDLWKVIDKIDALLGEIGEAAIERSWNILKNSPVKFSGNALKYVDDLSFPKLGGYFATLNTYNSKFKNEFADVARSHLKNMIFVI